MLLNTAKKAIQCNPNQGPLFGGGCDLSITDRCDRDSESVSNFPYSFNNEEKTYKFNQESWTKFTGNPKGRNYQIS